MPPPTYVFQFEDAAHARDFVHRLTLALNHLAIYIEDTQVMVLDGGDRSRRQEIARLARESSAALLAIRSPEETFRR
jgi:hypothetical protein